MRTRVTPNTATFYVAMYFNNTLIIYFNNAFATEEKATRVNYVMLKLTPCGFRKPYEATETGKFTTSTLNHDFDSRIAKS